MSKDRISDYDSTASGNEDVGGVNIQGTAPASNMDDSVREVMSHLADWAASDTIASGTTTDLGSKSAHALTVSGTTTITGFGTVKAGTIKFLTFSGALTITHNGTSLIIPGAANIVTAAGDTALVQSLGSGNWRVLHYQRATAGWSPPIITPFVEYTPTFTGFGTVPDARVFSRRVGDSLEMYGVFTAGTPTAVEARLTLGFNGVDGGLTVDSTKTSTDRILAGTGAFAGTFAGVGTVLADATEGYLQFGVQGASNAGLTSANGDDFIGAGNSFGFRATVPITGW